MTSFFAALLLFAILVLAIILVTCFVIGIGYIITLLFSFSLFEATLLCLAATFVAAFILDKLIKPARYARPYYDFADYDDDFEEDYDAEFDENLSDALKNNIVNGTYEKVSTVFKPAKVGRNQPCPCGSGKKYKYCCEKKNS